MFQTLSFVLCVGSFAAFVAAVFQGAVLASFLFLLLTGWFWTAASWDFALAIKRTLDERDDGDQA